MPKFVRNFWVELDCTGTKRPLATGPKSLDEGFVLIINIRSEGEVSDDKIVIRGDVVTNTERPGLVVTYEYKDKSQILATSFRDKE